MASPRLAVVLLIASQVLGTDAQCPPISGTATGSPQRLTSPNYPANYAPSVQCQTSITATSGVVHVRSIDMNLDGDSDNCADSLKFYNGNGVLPANLITTACGDKMISVQSTGLQLTIQFTSDGFREDTGFVLEYWQGEAYTATCTGMQEITLGDTPVTLHLLYNIGNDPVSCEYQFKGSDAGDMVMVDLLEWDEPKALECGNGEMKVYDGVSSNGTMMLEACGSDQPFWSAGSQGQTLSVKLNFTQMVPTTTFYVRAQKMAKAQGNCNMVNRLTTGSIPNYFWYPIFTANNANCEKTLVATEGKTPRITAPKGNCESALPFNATGLSMMCDNNMTMYQSTGPTLALTSQNGATPILVKAAAFEPYCNGGTQELMASNSSRTEVELSDLQRDSRCMWRLKAPTTMDSVSVMMESTLEDDECVMLYDGMDSSAAMLGQMCGSFEKQVISSQQYLFFSLNTNSQNEDGKLEVKFFALKSDAVCGEHNILAKREKVELTTPNYPMEYPLETMCMWRFVAYRPDFVVVVEVQESDLPEDCSDRAFVNDGETYDEPVLGEWCGNRKHVYRGTGQTLLVTFDADEMTQMDKKGFKFHYYADYETPRETVGGTDVLTIAGVLTIIVLAGGFIFITYRLCTQRRKQRALEADREPITQ